MSLSENWNLTVRQSGDQAVHDVKNVKGVETLKRRPLGLASAPEILAKYIRRKSVRTGAVQNLSDFVAAKILFP
jgi:hypothetical protein